MSAVYEVRRGCPADTEGRSEKEIKTYDFLDALGIEYFAVDHERTDTMEACAEIDGLLGVEMCKNLFLCNKQRTRFFLLMLPGEKNFRTADFSKQVGSSRVGFADEADMLALLGVYPGAVTLLGLMHDTEKRVSLCVDAELLEKPYLGLHPCVNTSSIRIRTEDAFSALLDALDHRMTVVSL